MEHDIKTVRLTGKAGQLRTLEQIEDDVLQLAIHHCGGNVTKAARDLGIGRSTVYRRLKELA